MAYPKKAKQENTNDSTVTAADAPQVATVAAPQVTGARGGAPTINSVQSANALRGAWEMTGTNRAFDRTFARTQFGADPGVLAQSMRSYFEGASTGASQTPLPTPSSLTLEQAQQYLKTLADNMKSVLDTKFKTLTAEQQASRFWQMYQQYPNEAAVLVARRVWTNQMTGTGPVADWLQWLER